MEDETVAYFDIQLAGRSPFHTHGSIEVCGNEQFVLGRDMACRYSWHDDVTISREHLRIHCILYEQDPVSDIAPFVYATDLSANGTHLKRHNAKCTSSQGRGILMGKNSSFLLDDGDELHLSETVTLIYRSLSETKQTGLTAVQHREKAMLSSRYLITDRLLGEGGYGKVLIAIDQMTQHQLACKIVNLEKLYDRRADLLMPIDDGQSSSSQAINRLPHSVQKCFREFDLLKDLSHPNIVHVQKVFWSPSTIYMFQELVTGGDLFSYIEYRHGKISSIESAVIIRQLLKGIEYLHAHDIVHRDLKPDNILMTSLDNGARVVITDFGHARFLPKTNTQPDHANNKLRRMFSVVGTVEYAAPEIHRANQAIPSAWGYSLAVDMWSLGSIAAAILTGELLFTCRPDAPFEEDAQQVIINRAAECNLSILDDEYHPLWGQIAFAPKDFIRRVLVLDEGGRMSATEALKHIWFTHPMMAAEFEAQYERSIKNWRPRQKDEQLIEQLAAFRATTTPQKSSDRAPFDAERPCFFRSGQTSFSEQRYMDDALSNGQFESQPESYAHNDHYSDNEAGSLLHVDKGSHVEKLHDAAPNLSRNGHGSDSEHSFYDPSLAQAKLRRNASKAATGQLHRVSTSARGRLFHREIEDLDDPSGYNSQHAINSFGSNCKRNEHTQAGSQHCETVQVRRTPFADSEDFGDLDLWWTHRYPATQYHYDTQAEPTSPDENDVLVQETPPDFVAKVMPMPQRKKGNLFKHHYEQRKPEPPSPYKITKQKKVYGRKR